MNASTWSGLGPSAPTDGFAAGLSMGMLEAKRADVLRAIQLRFRASVPVDIQAGIREIDDLDRLDRWLDAAITAPTLDSFRAATTWADRTTTN